MAEVGMLIEGEVANVVGIAVGAAVDSAADDDPIGVDAMKPSPSWYTLTELTCQKASLNADGLFFT